MGADLPSSNTERSVVTGRIVLWIPNDGPPMTPADINDELDWIGDWQKGRWGW